MTWRQGTMSDKREEVKAKIKKLLAMTVENGASEQEAMNAARVAGKLMDEYNLTHADIESLRADRYGARRRPFGSGKFRVHFHESVLTHGAIATYCNCKAWYQGVDLIFFGSEGDTDLAHYLAGVIRAAMDSEWLRYHKTNKATHANLHAKSVRTAFMSGMSARISDRLKAMAAGRLAEEQAAKPTTASTALILPQKERVVAEKFRAYAAQNGLNIRSSSRTQTLHSREAYDNGVAAGNRVAIGAAIGGKSAGNIGGRPAGRQT